MADQKLIENNARGPDVAFGGVGCLFEDLRRHVEGSSNDCLQ